MTDMESVFRIIQIIVTIFLGFFYVEYRWFRGKVEKIEVKAAEEKAVLIKELYKEFVDGETFYRGIGELKGTLGKIFDELKDIKGSIDKHIGEERD